MQACFWTPGGRWISWFCTEALHPCCSLCSEPCFRACQSAVPVVGVDFCGEQSPVCGLGEVWGCRCNAAAAEPVRGRFLGGPSAGCRGAGFAHCCVAVPCLREVPRWPSKSSATVSVASSATRAVARGALPFLCANSSGRTALSPSDPLHGSK